MLAWRYPAPKSVTGQRVLLPKVMGLCANGGGDRSQSSLGDTSKVEQSADTPHRPALGSLPGHHLLVHRYLKDHGSMTGQAA